MARVSARPALAASLIACCLLARPAFAQNGPIQIAELMVMTVCTDASGTIVPGVAPTDAACQYQRKLRNGEAAPYRLTDFAAATGPCANQQGIVARINVPVALDDTTRIVSFDMHVPRQACELTGDGVEFGASIEGDDTTWGYILGDAAPTGIVNFDSPSQCRIDPHDSSRFARGWVIGPAVLPPPGVPGYVAFRAVLSAGDPATVLQSRCPTGGPLALTTWVLDEMQFTSGLTLTALVSDHFSRADREGDGPGASQQMERTYWTAAFGLSRWEKWARDDWTGGTAPVAELARAAWTAGTCNAPHAMPAAPAMQVDPLQSTGAWSQIVRDANSGAPHAWMLVQCRDYTNLDRTVQPVPAPLPAAYTGWWSG